MSELAYDVSYTPDEPIEHVKSWRHNHCNGAWKLENKRLPIRALHGKDWDSKLQILIELAEPETNKQKLYRTWMMLSPKFLMHHLP